LDFEIVSGFEIRISDFPEGAIRISDFPEGAIRISDFPEGV
jgi:hypothetical protein